MNDQSKTKTQLIDELEQTRNRVAELEQVEEALRESEEKYRTIFENVNDQLIYLNKYGTIISANDHEETFGRTPEEIIGKNFTKLGYFDVKDIPKYLKLFKDVIAGKKTFDVMELEIKHKDGHKIPIEVSTSLVKKNGRIEGFICIVRDISERKQAEAALRENEERYRSLVESTDDAVYLIGRDMRYEFANRKYLSRLGLSLADLIGQEYVKLHPWDTIEEFAKKVDQVIKSGKPMTYEYLSHRDNKYFMRTLSPVIDEELGEIKAITVTSKDITERKRAEEELRQSEEKYRQLFATVSDAIVMFDANTRQFLDVNAKAIELYGYTREEFLRMKQPDISAEPKASELSISETLAGYRERIPLRYHKKKDDTVFPVEISSAIFNLGDQQVICGVIRDITERKQAEEALRESEEKFRLLFEHIPVGIFQRTPGGRLFTANPALVDMFGYDSEDDMRSISTTRELYVNPEDQDITARELESMGELRNLEMILKRKDGTSITVLENAYTVRGADGKTKYYEGTLIDITNRKQAEEALRDSQHMLQTVLDSIPSAVFWKDRDSTYLGGNRIWLEEVGLKSSDEVVGKSDYDLPWEKKQADSFREYDRKVIDSGIPEYDIIEPYLRADGARAWARTNKVPLHDTEDNVVGILGTYEDITERKRAEEAVQESQQQLSRIYDSVGDVLFYLAVEPDDCFRFLSINQAFLSSTGLTEDQIVGKRIEEVIPEPSVWMVRDNYIKAIEENRVVRWEETSEYPTGVKVGAVSIAPFFDDNGICTHLVGSILDITERKKAEETLAEEAVRRRILVDQSRDGIVVLDQDSKVYEANQRFAEMLGYSTKECRQLHVWDWDTQWTPEQLKEMIRTVDESGSHFETRHRRKDGTTHDVAISTNAAMFGEQKLVFCVCRDITDRKQAEEALRESEEKYRAIFEQAANSIVLIDAETGELIEFNDRTHEILGYTREEFEKLKIPDFEVIESVEEVAKHIEKIIKEGFDTFETKHRTKDGEIRNILVNSKAISIHGKDFVMSIWRDITERKRAEEALRESEEKYRQLFATVADAIVIYDTHTWQFIDVNQRAVELYGYTREEFLQMIQLDISAEPEASELSIKETLAGYRVHVSLQYHKKKDGTVFPVEISRGVYTFGERKVICGVIRDITETKLAEKALRESEEKYRSLVESSEDPIYLVDKDLQFLFANAKYLSRLGKSPDEVVGQGYAEFHSPEQVKEFAQKSEGVFKSCKPVVYEHKSLRDNRDFLRTLSPVIDPSTGRPTAITAISIDITERRRAQDELRESREQLRSLSAHLQTVREESQKLLAREIHDELGQDLTALKMDLSWMKGKLRQDQELLREKAAAMTKLADAMIKTVKKITARLRPALLDDLGVAAALEWELGEFAERTGIECNLTVKPEEIDLDPDRSTAVYRIFQEALTNIARHSQATSVEAALRVDSGRLEMEISDNGAGITKVQIASPRSFGLIGIRERAMQFGGEVRIEGVKGKGTTISITLPLDDGGDHHD